MSKNRYFKDTSQDGWPVFDRDKDQALSKKQVIERLNELALQLEQSQVNNKNLIESVKVALTIENVTGGWEPLPTGVVNRILNDIKVSSAFERELELNGDNHG